MKKNEGYIRHNEKKSSWNIVEENGVSKEEKKGVLCDNQTKKIATLFSNWNSEKHVRSLYYLYGLIVNRQCARKDDKTRFVSFIVHCQIWHDRDGVHWLDGREGKICKIQSMTGGGGRRLNTGQLHQKYTTHLTPHSNSNNTNKLGKNDTKNRH